MENTTTNNPAAFFEKMQNNLIGLVEDGVHYKYRDSIVKEVGACTTIAELYNIVERESDEPQAMWEDMQRNCQ